MLETMQVFLGKLIRECPDAPAIHEFLVYYAWENNALSDKIIELICENLAQTKGDMLFRQLFSLIEALQAIGDSIQHHRVDSSFRNLLAIVRNTRDAELCKKFVAFVERQTEKDPGAKRWVARHKDVLKEALHSAGWAAEINVHE